MKLFLFALLFFPTIAFSQVHKCTVDGKIVYSDRPCPDSGQTVGETIEADRVRRLAEQQQNAKTTFECDAWLQTPPLLYNSTWDGSVHEVEQWIKRNANNPKSVKFVGWSKVLRHCNGYSVQVRYRATNGFGALVAESRVFRMDRDGRYLGSDETNWSP